MHLGAYLRHIFVARTSSNFAKDDEFRGCTCQGWRVPKDAFVKDDENNQITSVSLSVQKGVVGDVIENFKMFGSS